MAGTSPAMTVMSEKPTAALRPKPSRASRHRTRRIGRWKRRIANAYCGRGKAQVKSLANNGRVGGEFVNRSSPHTVTRISCPQAAQWKMSMWVSSCAGIARDAASRIGLPQLQVGDSILSDEAIGFHLLLAPWGEIKGRE
jgi:hypothetical protein